MTSVTPGALCGGAWGVSAYSRGVVFVSSGAPNGIVDSGVGGPPAARAGFERSPHVAGRPMRGVLGFAGVDVFGALA
ncbi:hypothetical protein EHYA_09441 [Embleya hyalina]|uniref:Uncharacterized protein n=1 Tax=Embleya hyalina TaxID=516124 RepID=A0A401Z492_9ACTN|nr:hypothetical protein EHYA_09441 [Embleya hyalina]